MPRLSSPPTATGIVAHPSPPPFEVADIVRKYGAAFRETRPVSHEQARVLRAIAQCRTAVLGGHVEHCETSGSSLACPPLPPNHLRPGSLAPNFGDHGPSDSALTASSGWRLHRPAADRHAARCASRDLCSGARHSAPCALGGRRRVMDAKKVAMAVSLLQNPETVVADVCQTLKVSRATLYRYLPLAGKSATDGSA